MRFWSNQIWTSNSPRLDMTDITSCVKLEWFQELHPPACAPKMLKRWNIQPWFPGGISYYGEGILTSSFAFRYGILFAEPVSSRHHPRFKLKIGERGKSRAAMLWWFQMFQAQVWPIVALCQPGQPRKSPQETGRKICQFTRDEGPSYRGCV